MKDNSETRSSNTKTQGTNQSDSNQAKGSQSSKQANLQKGQLGNASGPSAQQAGSYNGEHAHAGSTGSSGGQISPQTHDTANAGPNVGQGKGVSGAGSSRRGNRKP